MNPSLPLELASSADFGRIFVKIALSARRRNAARRFEVPVAELSLGDPRISIQFQEAAPAGEAAATQPPPPRAAAPEPPIQIRAVHGRSTRCQCGTCMRCLDDDRWEKIFDERFADPHVLPTPDHPTQLDVGLRQVKGLDRRQLFLWVVLPQLSMLPNR